MSLTEDRDACYVLDSYGSDADESLAFDIGLQLPKADDFDPGVVSDGRYELTLAESGSSVGDLRVSYSVQLENDWFLTSTATARPDDLPEARALLETMLEGLDVPQP
jgi:hypothetical protein